MLVLALIVADEVTSGVTQLGVGAVNLGVIFGTIVFGGAGTVTTGGVGVIGGAPGTGATRPTGRPASHAPTVRKWWSG